MPRSTLLFYSHRTSINGGDISIRLLNQNRPREVEHVSAFIQRETKDRRIFHLRGHDEERKTRVWNEELFFFQLVV